MGFRATVCSSIGYLVLMTGGVFASGYEWIQAIPPAWSTGDAAQNLPVTVIEGEAIVGKTQAIIKPGGVVTQWTDSITDSDSGEEVVMSADQPCIYELDLEQAVTDGKPPFLDRLDLWVDNSSEARNAVDVEIQVSYDGNSFETVMDPGNQPGTKPAVGTCNLMTFDFSGMTKPVRKVRVIDKLAVTMVRGAQSPLWLEWDVVLKK